MGNRFENRIVLPNLRYKTAPKKDSEYKLPLAQNQKLLVEYDRSIIVGLQDVFDKERQESTIFRPAAKFSLIFKNSYAGFTNYPPFENNLSYINAKQSAIDSCPPNPSVAWSGLPLYNEFDFIRTDNNVEGYTQPPDEHLKFSNISASTYNWNFFLSYPFSNSTTRKLYYINQNNIAIDWICSEGIPFIIETGNENGINIISFKCPVKHGLSVGEAVKLSINYDGDDIFEIDSLGNGTSGSDEYYFNIINVGYTGTTFNTNITGTAKRIVVKDNPTDTTSKYYVKRHKIITNLSDAILVKAGFEQNIFGTKKKYESSSLTPDNKEKISTIEGSQSYTLSFNNDIDISELLDNQKRPITELFFTAIWVGYFGWTDGLKQGWEFNLPLSPANAQPNIWWDKTSSPSSASNTGIQTSAYTTTLGSGPFKYNKSLKNGDLIDGDFCEWNDYEQQERVLSKIYHKFTFNGTHFKINSVIPTNPLGYYYQPHHPITLRVFSPYIEEGDTTEVNIPNYSYYSTTVQKFIWRDLYSYGFIDSDFIGVNYPFLNGKHYPFTNIIFRIIPEGTNYNEQTIIPEPTIDDCE